MAAPRFINELTAASSVSAGAALALFQDGSTLRCTPEQLITSAASFTQSGSGAVARDVQGRLREYVSVLDFIPTNLHAGIAAGTETSSLSTYIQSAIDSLSANGGRLYFPAGTYYIASTLNLFRSGAPFSFDVFGAGMLATRILWNGATTGTAVKIQRAVRFFFGHLRIDNNVATGTTKGLQITSEAASSQTGPGTVMNVRVSGFEEDVSIGEAAGNAASEITFCTLEVASATYGVIIRASNSLTNKFFGLNGSSCGTVLEAAASGPDCVWVYGGSSSGSTTQDFAFRNAGAYGIYGFRSESAERFCTIGPDAGAGASAPTVITINGCQVTATDNADNRVIRLNKACRATIEGNVFQDGHIYIDSANTVSGSLSLKNNCIVSTTDLEVETDAYNWQIEKYGNTDAASGAGNFWPNGDYFISSNGVGPALELNDDFLGDVIASHWNTRVGTDAQCQAATILASQAGGWIRMITGNDVTADMVTDGTLLESDLNWQPDRGSLSMELRIKFNALDIAIFFGFKGVVGSGALANTDMPFTLAAGDVLTSNVADAFGVLYDQSADTDNWWGVGVANNVDATAQNFAVAPTANVWTTWRIEYRGTSAYFYRNGALVGSAMSGPVTATIPLTPCVVAFPRAGSDRRIDIDYIRVRGNR